MLVSLVAGWLVLQSAEIGPVCPPGSSAAFQQTVTRVGELLEEGKFAEASKLASRLPSRTITVGWDDREVPAAQKTMYRRALERSIAVWRRQNEAYEFKIASKGDLQFTFAKSLPVSQESGLPAGAVHFVSDDPSEPRLETVIATTRMNPPVSVEAPSIEMECAFAIGSYLGLAAQPKLGTAMGRTDGLTQLRVIVAQFEIQIAERNVEIAEILRKAAKEKTRLTPARPELFVNPMTLDMGTNVQGKLVETSFQVENRGNVPMTFAVVPDCSCFILTYRADIQPGSTGLVRVVMDTTEFPGPINKALYVFSGDPEFPQRRINVTGMVEPLYRIVNEERTGTIQMAADGARGVFYVLTSEKNPITVESVAVSGVNGIADIEPWQGIIADPELKEAARPRNGYRITVLMSPSQIRGRVMGTLKLKTDSQTFPNILHSFYVQRGIAANPTTLFLGDIAKEPMRAWVLLSKPGRPFKVLQITSSNPNLKGSAEALPAPGEYKLIVEYSGKGDLGPISGVITVKTDDKDQPVIEVPVQGNVT